MPWSGPRSGFRVSRLSATLVVGLMASVFALAGGPPASGQTSDREPSQNNSAAAPESSSDPDLPGGVSGIDPGEYLRLRAAHVARRRGVNLQKPTDPAARGRAIRVMQSQRAILQSLAAGVGSAQAPPASWTPLGPAPIPNGQTS